MPVNASSGLVRVQESDICGLCRDWRLTFVARHVLKTYGHRLETGGRGRGQRAPHLRTSIGLADGSTCARSAGGRETCPFAEGSVFIVRQRARSGAAAADGRSGEGQAEGAASGSRGAHRGAGESANAGRQQDRLADRLARFRAREENVKAARQRIGVRPCLTPFSKFKLTSARAADGGRPAN
jgi:hypothetical protein